MRHWQTDQGLNQHKRTKIIRTRFVQVRPTMGSGNQQGKSSIGPKDSGIYVYINLSIDLSIYPSIHPSIYLPVCFSTSALYICVYVSIGMWYASTSTCVYLKYTLYAYVCLLCICIIYIYIHLRKYDMWHLIICKCIQCKYVNIHVWVVNIHKWICSSNGDAKKNI